MGVVLSVSVSVVMVMLLRKNGVRRCQATAIFTHLEPPGSGTEIQIQLSAEYEVLCLLVLCPESQRERQTEKLRYPHQIFRQYKLQPRISTNEHQ